MLLHKMTKSQDMAIDGRYDTFVWLKTDEGASYEGQRLEMLPIIQMVPEQVLVEVPWMLWIVIVCTKKKKTHLPFAVVKEPVSCST
jgi:hypothetical protein